MVAYKFGTEEEIGKHLGTYHYFIEIMRRLVKLGHEVWVVAPWLSFNRKGSVGFDGIKIKRYFPPLLNIIWFFPINRLLRFWYLKATQKQILKLEKNYKLAVVLVWQARETGYAVSTIKNQLKAPFIFRQITTWQWHWQRSVAEIFGKRRWYKIIANFRLNKFLDNFLEILLDRKNQKEYAKVIYEKADRIVFTSQIASKEGIKIGLVESKIEILPVCLETELFKPLNQKKELRQKLGIKGKKIILFIGRINFAEKGVGYLLEAMPKIISEILDVNLVIIGDGGESERMVKLIKELKIENSVQLVGRKSFEDLVLYINASDVFVMPSVWLETFGQVTIEAMACGVPVVTSDAGASPEINISGRTGLVVPAKNSEKLAEAIIKLLNNDFLREEFGQNARERVINNYTYEAVVDKLLKIIEDVKHGG